MDLSDVLEEGLRPSKRCGPNQVWNPARQRCQDRYTGEPTPPEPTYPQQGMDVGQFFMILLEMMKLGNAIMGSRETEGEQDGGII